MESTNNPQDDWNRFEMNERDNDDLRDNLEEDSEIERETDAEDDEPGDWGVVDPQEHPGLHDSNDPTAPGSAV